MWLNKRKKITSYAQLLDFHSIIHSFISYKWKHDKWQYQDSSGKQIALNTVMNSNNLNVKLLQTINNNVWKILIISLSEVNSLHVKNILKHNLNPLTDFNGILLMLLIFHFSGIYKLRYLFHEINSLYNLCSQCDAKIKIGLWRRVNLKHRKKLNSMQGCFFHHPLPRSVELPTLLNYIQVSCVLCIEMKMLIAKRIKLALKLILINISTANIKKTGFKPLFYLRKLLSYETCFSPMGSFILLFSANKWRHVKDLSQRTSNFQTINSVLCIDIENISSKEKRLKRSVF